MSSKITVSLGETINLGNYENLKLFVAIEKEVPNETVEDKTAFLAETKALFEMANKAIELQKDETPEESKTVKFNIRGF